MAGKNWRRMIGKMAAIAAVLVMGMGTQTVHAGYLFSSAVSATYAGYSQGLSQMSSSSALINDSTATLYEAYLYMLDAESYADDAYYYAGLVSGDWAYYAWVYSDEAWYYFGLAADNAYYAWAYSNPYYTYVSLYYGGAGAYYIAFAEAYAGIGCNGGYN